MLKLLIPVQLDEREFEALWLRASRKGTYSREDPRKRWTLFEKKECVRHYLQEVIQEELNQLEIGERVASEVGEDYES